MAAQSLIREQVTGLLVFVFSLDRFFFLIWSSCSFSSYYTSCFNLKGSSLHSFPLPPFLCFVPALHSAWLSSPLPSYPSLCRVNLVCLLPAPYGSHLFSAFPRSLISIHSSCAMDFCSSEIEVCTQMRNLPWCHSVKKREHRSRIYVTYSIYNI